MTAARAQILARIREARPSSSDSPDVSPDNVPAGDGPPGDIRSDDVAARLAARASGPVPVRGRDRDAGTLRARFIAEASRAGSDVVQVAARDGVPRAVVDYLAGKGRTGPVRVSGDPFLSGLDWSLPTGGGPVQGDDRVAVSVPVAAVAETGTVVMASSPQNPAMYGFLPEIHVAVLPDDRIVGNYEQVWSIMRRHDARPSFMPRSVTMITGPSRTADIEQTLLMGAHGPCAHLIVLAGRVHER